MNKLPIVALAALVASAGCTAFSLERYTLNQIQSTADFRYKAVLNCLAAVAADPNALPSFCILSDGLTRIQDSESLSSTTTWTRAVGSFAMENLGVTVSRSPQEQWTVIPVAEYTQLAAMRCACLWVLDGPERACNDCPGLLDSAEYDHSLGPHYGVAERLERITPGWLGVGKLKDVPRGACYKAHCGNTWVWVTPEGMKGLADFTLVLLDIATLDVAHGAGESPIVVTLVRYKSFPTMSYQLAKSSLPSLIAAGIQPAVVDKLVPLTMKKPMNEAAFLRELGAILDPKEQAKYKEFLLKQAKLDLPYSPQVSFPEYRMIKNDDLKDRLQAKIKEAIRTGQRVAISWDDWRKVYTDPYHGTRSNVKPDGSIAQPVPQPVPTRALPIAPLPPPGFPSPLPPGSLLPPPGSVPAAR
jgi:hypothetical protein